MEVISIKSTKDLKSAANQFVQLIGDRKIFAFYGGMGAGKTTFIKAICIFGIDCETLGGLGCNQVVKFEE